MGDGNWEMAIHKLQVESILGCGLGENWTLYFLKLLLVVTTQTTICFHFHCIVERYSCWALTAHPIVTPHSPAIQNKLLFVSRPKQKGRKKQTLIKFTLALSEEQGWRILTWIYSRLNFIYSFEKCIKHSRVFMCINVRHKTMLLPDLAAIR